MALDARLDGLLDPEIVRYIPSNCSSSFCDWNSLNSRRSAGLPFSIGLIRLSEMDSPSLSDGYTIIAGDGSCWMMYPSMFSNASEPPTCVHLQKIISSVS